jgi:transcriptional regulator with XRE-family HTH domain
MRAGSPRLRLQDLSDAAGVSVPMLSLVERGRRRLTPQTAAKIPPALKG